MLGINLTALAEYRIMFLMQGVIQSGVKESQWIW